jgi:trimeric autotransporter adhesin
MAAQSHSGYDSIAIGYQSLSAPNSNGQYNIMIGNAAGGNLAAGSRNVGIGRRALSNSVEGNYNTAIGNDAMASAGSGSFNTAIGHGSLISNTNGIQNVAIGASSLALCTNGSNNVAVGRYSTQALTLGTGNTALGEQSLHDNVDGHYNTAIGKNACAGGSSYSNTVSLGFNSACTGSNQVTLGNSNIAYLRCATPNITTLSDKRDKYDINQLGIGLNFLNKVSIVKYKWNTRDGSKYTKEFEPGVIAQQLLELQNSENLAWLNLVDQSNLNRLEATPGKLLYIAIQAIQDLSTKVDALQRQLAVLKPT